MTSKTMKVRWGEHISHAKHPGHPMLVVRAIRKYGRKQFKLELLGRYYSVERALQKEQYFIKLFGCRHPNGYNMTDGGEGVFGLEWTPEMRKRQSEILMGHAGTPWSAGQRENMMSSGDFVSFNRKGKCWTDEQRVAFSARMKGKRPSFNAMKAVAQANRKRKGKKYRKTLKKLGILS